MFSEQNLTGISYNVARCAPAGCCIAQSHTKTFRPGETARDAWRFYTLEPGAE
jgi:hypothetical protein